MKDITINEEDIVFFTTSLQTKWLEYHSKIIKKLFPLSDHIVVYGGGVGVWPNSWFYWIEKLRNHKAKYFVRVDEDFFFTNKTELLKVIKKIETENIDIMGVPDGYQIWRQCNPVAMNSFLLVGRVDILRDLYVDRSAMFNEDFKKDFDYKFKIFEPNTSSFYFNGEPYYCFFWALKERGYTFDYLYPYFDERFKSTNPRMAEDSNDIGIHMWYTREWDLDFDVCGTPNNKRYQLVEEFLKSKGY